MDINYTEMINHDLKALSQDNLRKAWSYVNALTTLQRSEEELKAIEYDLGIRREQAENSDRSDLAEARKRLLLRILRGVAHIHKWIV